MVNYNSNSSSGVTKTLVFPCKLVYFEQYPTNLGINHYEALIITVIVIGLMVVVSNGVFLFVVLKTRTLQTMHNMLLISLSINDFLTGVTVMPLFASTLVFLLHKEFHCDVFWAWAQSFYSVVIISFGTIVLVSFEKYLAIMHTFYFQRVITKRKIILFALIAWTIGIALPPITYAIGLPYPHIHQWFWLFWSYLGCLFYFAVVYCHARMFKEVMRVRRAIRAQSRWTEQHLEHNHHRVIRRHSKVAMTTAIVISALTVCYMPHYLLYIFSAPIHKSGLSGKSLLLLELITYIVILFNSVLNPIVYYIRMSSVRLAFKRIFSARSNSP